MATRWSRACPKPEPPARRRPRACAPAKPQNTPPAATKSERGEPRSISSAGWPDGRAGHYVFAFPNRWSEPQAEGEREPAAGPPSPFICQAADAAACQSGFGEERQLYICFKFISVQNRCSASCISKQPFATIFREHISHDGRHSYPAFFASKFREQMSRAIFAYPSNTLGLYREHVCAS